MKEAYEILLGQLSSLPILTDNYIHRIVVLEDPIAFEEIIEKDAVQTKKFERRLVKLKSKLRDMMQKALSDRLALFYGNLAIIEYFYYKSRKKIANQIYKRKQF